MPRSLFRLALPCLLAGSFVHAQDAGLALRTSVGYNTQRASLPLSDEQRQEADRLGREAQKASQARNYGEAMKDYQQGTAVMRKIEWTPAYELAVSLQGRLDHAVVEPGKAVNLTLTPLYTDDRERGVKLTGTVSLLPVKRDAGDEKTLVSGLKLDPSSLPLNTRLTLPAGITGDFNLEVRLAPEGDTPAEAARAAYTKTLPVHIEALSADAQSLKDKLAKAKKGSPALATAEYALALYEKADTGEINPARYNLHEEFAKAVAIVDTVNAGQDPFGSKHGDFRKAYRSAVDNTLQPYRIFIPAAYDGSKPTPLVVALHGMGGDENSMFDGYKETLKREAERLGLIVACPKGRDSDGLAKIKSIPEYVVHGDDDRTVNVSQSRRMVAAGKKIGAPITYVEVPGGSHVSVAEPNFAPMLDFFAKQQRSDSGEVRTQ